MRACFIFYFLKEKNKGAKSHSSSLKYEAQNAFDGKAALLEICASLARVLLRAREQEFAGGVKDQARCIVFPL